MKERPQKRTKLSLDTYLTLADDYQYKDDNDYALDTLEKARQFYPEETEGNYLFHLLYGIVLCKIKPKIEAEDDSEIELEDESEIEAEDEPEAEDENVEKALLYFEWASNLNNSVETFSTIAEILNSIDRIECLKYYSHLLKQDIISDAPNTLVEYLEIYIHYAQQDKYQYHQRFKLYIEAKKIFTKLQGLECDNMATLRTHLIHVNNMISILFEANTIDIIENINQQSLCSEKKEKLHNELYDLMINVLNYGNSKDVVFKKLSMLHPNYLEFLKQNSFVLENQDESSLRLLYSVCLSHSNPLAQHKAQNKLNEYYDKTISSARLNGQTFNLTTLATSSLLKNSFDKLVKHNAIKYIQFSLNNSIQEFDKFSDRIKDNVLHVQQSVER